MSSIRANVELILGAIILSVILFLCGRYVYMSWKSDSLEAQNDVLTSDAEADQVYVREYKTVITEREAKNEQVDRALERNRDWADEPLPDDVADILRDPAESAP
jgi:hypothetical protein